MIALQPLSERKKLLKKLATTREELQALEYSWDFLGRPKQQEPPGDWWIWLLLAGRGFGKTRTLAEWLRKRVELGARRIYVVGRSAKDVRDVIVEGESGILAISPPWNRPKYEPSKCRLTWPSGAVATCFSAEEPDQLRGPACDTLIADELAAWKYPETWSQALLGLRSKQSGLAPRACVATTPRPLPIIKEFFKESGEYAGKVFITRGSTKENRQNLADEYYGQITRKFEGTRLGRQELDAEILDDAPGALWKRAAIDSLRIRLNEEGKLVVPPLRKVVVAIDPAVSSHQRTTAANANDPVAREASRDRQSNETGILVGGIDERGHGYLLEDVSGIYTPHQWATKAIELFDKYEADHVTAEVNQGGDLVVSNLHTVRRGLPVRPVRASRGKFTRAEPVAALTEQKRIHHVGSFGQLEDQLCSWEPDSGAKSPDRLDAYVWLFADLMVLHDPKTKATTSKGGFFNPGTSFEDREAGI